ncbi:MAG: IPT/TIG domain-containing protein, partial [Bacteroidota bacterium]
MKNLNLLLLLCLILLAGCQKDEIALRPFPRLETLPVSEISDEGAVFNGLVFESEGQAVLRHGFVWASRRIPELNRDGIISELGAPKAARFSMEIRSGLRIGEPYTVRAFIETDQYVVYGNPTSFKSLGSSVPILTSVEPAQASWGDTITVRGKFFSQDTSSIEAFLNSVSLKVVSTSSTLAQFVIPPIPNQEEVQLKMITQGAAALGQLPFKYDKVEIQEIIPTQPRFQDTLHVKLKHFNEKHFDLILEGRPIEPLTIFNDSII